MAVKSDLEKTAEEEREQREQKEQETKQRGTTYGYSGAGSLEGEGPAPQYKQDLPEGTVISPLGVTRPPEPGLLDPYLKERSDDPQVAGKVLVKGKTHHGYKYERIVEILQPRTEKGMFQVFKAHFPDAVEEDFSVEAVSDERAAELEKEWSKKLMGQQKEREEKARNEREGGSKRSSKKNGNEQDKEDYESLTVADLRSRMDERGVEYKHDWNKADHIKALEKADKEKS